MKKRGHRLRKQRGGASGLYIIEVEFSKNGQKLDTKALQDQGDPLFDELDMLWNTISGYLKEKGFDLAELEELDEHENEIETYPPMSAQLLDYEGDGEPKLPRTIKVNVPGEGDIVVKFVKLKKVGEADPAPMEADPNRPVGAGAGPAGAAAVPLPASPPPPSKKEEEDAARYKQDEDMAGGRKKRRSKTRKHKKRHGTRRRY